MSDLNAQDAQFTVELTAHPLQRVGVYALMALADVEELEEMTPELVREKSGLLLKDLQATARVDKAQDPGGFWLGASYLMWPNSKMNTTNRGRQPEDERRQRIEEWRAFPAEESRPDAPCALCGRPAAGFYGKVDVPLGASTAYRNTTPRGHEGLALCFACLTCFWALPYGCVIGGGRAAALHSWDERFMADVLPMQVRRTRQQAALAVTDKKPVSYFRQVAALRALRGYEEPLKAGVELIIFSNSNKEQFLDVHTMDQPLAEWLRNTMRADSGYRFLVRAHCSKDVPGTAGLARNVFSAPPYVLRRVVSYLAARPKDDLLLGETAQLVPLCLSYATEVLDVRENDIQRLAGLARNIAEILEPTRARGALKGFEVAYRDPARLRHWLRKAAVGWALQKGGPPERDGVRQPFVSDGQWLLLFDGDTNNRLHQDLLLVMVLGELAHRGWAADDVSARDDLDDALTSDTSEEI
jgi:hypothetical protein